MYFYFRFSHLHATVESVVSLVKAVSVVNEVKTVSEVKAVEVT